MVLGRLFNFKILPKLQELPVTAPGLPEWVLSISMGMAGWIFMYAKVECRKARIVITNFSSTMVHLLLLGRERRESLSPNPLRPTALLTWVFLFTQCFLISIKTVTWTCICPITPSIPPMWSWTPAKASGINETLSVEINCIAMMVSPAPREARE